MTDTTKAPQNALMWQPLGRYAFGALKYGYPEIRRAQRVKYTVDIENLVPKNKNNKAKYLINIFYKYMLVWYFGFIWLQKY